MNLMSRSGGAFINRRGESVKMRRFVIISPARGDVCVERGLFCDYVY